MKITVKRKFSGNAIYYSFVFLFLLFMSFVTFGLFTPFFIYWNVQYFSENNELEINTHE
jgi:uncharacterized membrane protein YjgN (DUF898 family)